MQVSTGKSKQDLIIADIPIKHVVGGGILEESQRFKLQQMMVKTFNKVKFLSYPKEGGSFVPINDIGDTA